MSAYQFDTPTTGQTITVAAGIRNEIVKPAGALAALTVIFPPNPTDEDLFGLSVDQQVNALTLHTSDGTIIDHASLTGLFYTPTGGQRNWLFVGGTQNTWFPV